jgi:hypothetical protein
VAAAWNALRASGHANEWSRAKAQKRRLGRRATRDLHRHGAEAAVERRRDIVVDALLLRDQRRTMCAGGRNRDESDDNG